jgi:hypothetical protein
MRAQERGLKGNIYFPVNDYGPVVDPNCHGKGLQLEFTVQDEVAFTRPWSDYRRAVGECPEFVCAKNRHEYYAAKDTGVPQANKPDF